MVYGSCLYFKNSIPREILPTMVTKNYALSSDSLQIVYSFGVTGMGPVSLLSFEMRRSFVMLHPFAVAISGFCALGCAAIERCEENQLPSYWRA